MEAAQSLPRMSGVTFGVATKDEMEVGPTAEPETLTNKTKHPHEKKFIILIAYN